MNMVSFRYVSKRDIPVFQISIILTHILKLHYRMGRELKSREKVFCLLQVMDLRFRLVIYGMREPRVLIGHMNLMIIYMRI